MYHCRLPRVNLWIEIRILLLNLPTVVLSPSETQEGKSPSPSISRHASFDTDQVSRDFVDFLKNLQKPGREIHKQCRAFIMNMSSKKVCCSVECFYNLIKCTDKHRMISCSHRTWVLRNCRSVFRISTRAWRTVWWVTLKVGSITTTSKSR